MPSYVVLVTSTQGFDRDWVFLKRMDALRFIRTAAEQGLSNGWAVVTNTPSKVVLRVREDTRHETLTITLREGGQA